ncbi:MAG: DUF447 domain-containing protein [Planctomycetia bacterium]
MILEGLVTTCDAKGRMHLAAMGPEADEADVARGTIARLVLKPFATSQTATNLARLGAGVFHAVDDALLIARVVTGAAGPPPVARPASAVRGWVLADACRAFEFEIAAADRSGERQRLEARVVATHEGRPFVGLNRATHAVVEGAILVTRVHLLGADEVRRRLADLAVLVEKTGGERAREAFRLLEGQVDDTTG